MAELIRDWFLDPVVLLFLASLTTIALVLSFCARFNRHSRFWISILVSGWLGVFLVSTAPVVVNPLLTTLEAQHPASITCEPGSHLVVLGGGIDSGTNSSVEFERMSRSTMARATAAMRIAIEEPELHLIASGGLRKTVIVSEADVIAGYWMALGIDSQRIIIEGQSKTTHENAKYVARLLTVQQVRSPVRILTSAVHMPRALASFRKLLEPQGLEVCPVSADNIAMSEVPWWAFMPQTTALVKFDLWLHEIVALAFYRLRGWI